jgi:putative transposase
VSVRKAIELGQFSHGGWYAKSQARDQSALRLRIREIAHARPRFGYRRIHVMLRREGWTVNRKRVYRWYRHEGLQIRMRVRRRKHMCLHRGPVPQAKRTHERWSMDFVHDQLFEGRAFRVLTIVDQFSRQSPLLGPVSRSAVTTLSQHWIGQSSRLAHRARSRSIMARSSLPRRWRNGRIVEA